MKLFASIALAVATTAFAAPVGDDYAYAWLLLTGTGTGTDSAAWQVVLTPEVYAAVTRTDLFDVDVLDASGTPVASAVHRPSVNAGDEALRSLTLFALPARAPTAGGEDTVSLHVRRDADGTLRSVDALVAAPRKAAPDDGRASGRVLIADASAIKAPLAELVIDWDPHDGDVTAQFALDASDDLEQWRSVVSNLSVLRLVRGSQTLERHAAALRSVRAPYLRLRRLDDGPALHGLRVSVRPVAPATPSSSTLEWVTATPAGSEAVSGGAGVVYRYRLPALLPVEVLRMRLVDDNALASITARTTASAGAPMPLGRTVAFRLRQGDTVLENDDMPFTPGGRIDEVRLETSAPLAHAPTLSVAYRPDRLVFLAQGTGPFRLVAGSATRTRAVYPMANALDALRAQSGATWQPPLATLGPREISRGESARMVSMSHPPDWRSWILWAVLGGAALLIGGMALKLLRATPHED